MFKNSMELKLKYSSVINSFVHGLIWLDATIGVPFLTTFTFNVRKKPDRQRKLAITDKLWTTVTVNLKQSTQPMLVHSNPVHMKDSQ